MNSNALRLTTERGYSHYTQFVYGVVSEAYICFDVIVVDDTTAVSFIVYRKYLVYDILAFNYQSIKLPIRYFKFGLRINRRVSHILGQGRPSATLPKH